MGDAMKAPLHTFIVEIDDESVGSYVVVQDREFKAYFVDKVEGIVDVRVYRLDSDETVQYTIPQFRKEDH